MKLGDRLLPTSVLISPDVAEIMLSYQWMHDNRCVWDFNNHVMRIDGQSVPLCSKKARSAMVCRRVYVENDVLISPRHQVTVPARSTVDNLRMCNDNDWLIEPKEFRPGVFLVRTLLPDRHRDIAVRVVNTTNEPHRLPKDFCLGDLSQAEELGAEPLPPLPVQAPRGSPRRRQSSRSNPLKEMSPTLWPS